MKIKIVDVKGTARGVPLFKIFSDESFHLRDCMTTVEIIEALYNKPLPIAHFNSVVVPGVIGGHYSDGGTNYAIVQE
jgi:hypothetical protein